MRRHLVSRGLLVWVGAAILVVNMDADLLTMDDVDADLLDDPPPPSKRVGGQPRWVVHYLNDHVSVVPQAKPADGPRPPAPVPAVKLSSHLSAATEKQAVNLAKRAREHAKLDRELDGYHGKAKTAVAPSRIKPADTSRWPSTLELDRELDGYHGKAKTAVAPSRIKPADTSRWRCHTCNALNHAMKITCAVCQSYPTHRQIAAKGTAVAEATNTSRVFVLEGGALKPEAAEGTAAAEAPAAPAAREAPARRQAPAPTPREDLLRENKSKQEAARRESRVPGGLFEQRAIDNAIKTGVPLGRAPGGRAPGRAPMLAAAAIGGEEYLPTMVHAKKRQAAFAGAVAGAGAISKRAPLGRAPGGPRKQPARQAALAGATALQQEAIADADAIARQWDLELGHATAEGREHRRWAEFVQSVQGTGDWRDGRWVPGEVPGEGEPPISIPAPSSLGSPSAACLSTLNPSAAEFVPSSCAARQTSASCATAAFLDSLPPPPPPPLPPPPLPPTVARAPPSSQDRAMQPLPLPTPASHPPALPASAAVSPSLAPEATTAARAASAQGVEWVPANPAVQALLRRAAAARAARAAEAATSSQAGPGGRDDVQAARTSSSSDGDGLALGIAPGGRVG